MNSRLTIRIRKANQRGVEWSIAHILKAKIDRPGGNEFCVEERLAAQFGNLPLPVDRENKYSISSQLEAAARPSRSKEKVRMVILSFEDTSDPRDRDAQVALMPALVQAFIGQFAPGATYWAGVHVDRNHVHCHLTVANWSPVLNTSLNWSKRDLTYMLSMRWTQRDPVLAVSVEAGAWTKQKRTVMAYPRSEACRLLVEELLPDPEATVTRLELKGELTRYQTKGGHAGVVFGGRKITLKNVNYELAKLGASIGLDDDYHATPLVIGDVDELCQQTRIDAALGVGKMTLADFDRLCDLPDPFILCRTDEERDAIHRYKRTGRIIDPRHAAVLARLCRTAILRRCLGARTPLDADRDGVCGWVYDRNSWGRFMIDCLNNCLWHLVHGIPPGSVRVELDGLVDLLESLGRDIVQEIDGPVLGD